MAHETKAGTADAVPDSFGPRHHGIVRRGNVRVNGRQKGRVNADNELLSLPRRGRTSFFLCYGCVVGQWIAPLGRGLKKPK
jgi:hypothetical protein